MRRVACLALTAAVLHAGCAPDVPFEEQPAAVRALWNPTTGVVPTPTDLVRDEAAGQLSLPLDADLPAAELEFRRYLNSLDGYPLQSSLTIPMSGPISVPTLGGALVMLDVDANVPVPLAAEVADDGLALVARPLLDGGEGGLQAGRRYVFGLRGYEGGVKGVSGVPVVSDAAFYFVKAENNLTEHPYSMPAPTRHERAELAETLEEVRVGFQPLYDGLEARGVPRGEVAVASAFTTTARPSIWFDPDRSKIPLPNGLLIDEQTGLVSIPPDDDDDAETAELKAAYSEYEGFGVSAALVLEATSPIDPTTVHVETVRLLGIDDQGDVFEELELSRGVLQDSSRAWVKPRLSLKPATTYVWVATRGVTSAGLPLEPQPVAALLRSTAILSEGGASQVGVLDDDSAALLERWRVAATPALDWLDSQGTSRDSLSVVVPFRTMPLIEPFHALRARLYEAAVPTQIANVVAQTPLERGLPLILNSVETVVTGTFTIDDYIDPRTKRWRADGPQPGSIDFVLTIPENTPAGAPIPVILFGHGLFTSRELVYLIADKMAESGWAMFAFDFPYHGLRSACLRNADCSEGACDEFGRCTLPGGAAGEFAKISSPFPGGPEYPAATGSAFIEVEQIVAARDHFRQGLVDLFQALRVIRGADWAAATGYALDGDDVVYLGMSLGGILGSMFAALEPTVETFALNVAGGNLFQIFKDSSAFQTAFAEVLMRHDAPAGSDAYFELELGLRWLFDSVDPMTIAPFALAGYEWRDPVDGATKSAPVKRVLLQMSEGDLVVPNSSTATLSDAMGVPVQRYTPLVSNHAFLFDPTSFEGARARQDIVEFFDAR